MNIVALVLCGAYFGRMWLKQEIDMLGAVLCTIFMGTILWLLLDGLVGLVS